jgi:8-oxo-dGTP pyrophosphatase MutT (NUDIX family)
LSSYVEWLRNQIGTRKVFLPFATVILWDDQGRVLLQRRTDFDFWGLPGGVLEMGEDIESGARRELLEETGLTAGDLSLVGIYTDPKYDVTYPNGDQVQQFTFCLQGEAAGGSMKPDGVETTHQVFVPIDEMDRYMLPVWYRDMLVEARSNGEPTFRAPQAPRQSTDQIANVRPFIGHERFSGMGVSVVLTREDGKLLMLQHVNEEHWRLPAGYCELGENAAQTAVREMWEELGLHIKVVRIVGVHANLNSTYANGDQVRIVGVVFFALITGGTRHLEKTEIADLAWMAPQEIVASVDPSRHDHYVKIIRHLHEGFFIS